MGVAVSKIWGSGPRYTSDSITGLSGEEKALLADTFNVLKQDLGKSGERLFILFFLDYPDAKNFFKDFKGKSIEELTGSPKLIAHGTNVMLALQGIITNLNSPEIIVELIRKIGLNHGRRNIPLPVFLELKPTVLKLVEEQLKNKYTPEVRDVWAKTLDVIGQVFAKGMEEYHNEKDDN